MSESYLQLRRSNLLNRLESESPNTEETIEQIAEINLALGTSSGGSFSTLATEATSTAINAKLPSLSSGRVPVSLPTITAELDCRLLTTNTTIATGSYFIYLKVLVGDVTINGLTFSSGENLNFETINNVLYPAIELVIPSGKSVRLVRGY